MIQSLITTFGISFFMGCFLGYSVGLWMQSKRAMFRSLSNAD